MNDDNKLTKKDVKNKDKQEEILKKIFNILNLNINETNTIFNTTKFNNNKEIQDNIQKLEAEIYMFYSHSKWKYFKSNDPENKNLLSLLKSIFSHHNYKLYPLKIDKDKGYLLSKN